MVSWLLLSCLCILSLLWLAVFESPLRLREGRVVWSLLPTNKEWGTWKGFRVQDPHRFLFGFKSISHSVMSASLWPLDCSSRGSSVHGVSPGKNTGVCCYFLLQGIFPTQGLHPGLLQCRQIFYRLSHQGSRNSPQYLQIYICWI